MKTLDPNDFLTLDVLCDEATQLGCRYKLMEKGEKFSPRTIRFYIEKELLPPVRSGPGKKYPYETVWKILFIRLASKKHEVPLNYLRESMQVVDVETMRRVVTGEEPLETSYGLDSGGAKRHAAQGYQVLALTGGAQGRPGSNDWQLLVSNEDVVLQVRKGVRPARLKQLKHIAALIRTLCEDT